MLQGVQNKFINFDYFKLKNINFFKWHTLYIIIFSNRFYKTLQLLLCMLYTYVFLIVCDLLRFFSFLPLLLFIIFIWVTTGYTPKKYPLFTNKITLRTLYGINHKIFQSWRPTPKYTKKEIK